MAEDPGMVPEIIPPSSAPVRIWHWSLSPKTAKIIQIAVVLPLLGCAGWLIQNFLQLRGIVDLLASRIDLAFLAVCLFLVGCALTIGLKHKLGLRTVIGIAILLGAVGVDWWAPKPVKPQRARQVRSKLEITEARGIKASSVKYGAGLAFNLSLKNTGDLPAQGMMHACDGIVVNTNAPLATQAEEQFADHTALIPPGLTFNTYDEIQPGATAFFTCPDKDSEIAGLGARIDNIEAGRSRIYLFVAMHYRDESLSPDFDNVTEFCGWFSGQDLTLRHSCGRNLIFSEKIREK